MTRQVTITNTSNWKGENVEIVLGTEEPVVITLKPGESTTMTPTPNAQHLEIAATGDTMGYFTDDEGGQVFPEVEVKWKR